MTVSRTRPTGISLIAFLFLIEAVVALGLAAFLLLSTNGWPGLGSLFERLQLPAALTSLFALPPLLTAGLAGFEFRGLWQQREWARLAALVLALLTALLALAALAFLTAFDLASRTVLGGIIGAFLLASLMFLYLLRTRFGSETTPATVDAEIVEPEPVYIERTPAAAPPRPAPPPGPMMDELVPPPPRTPRLQPQYEDAETVASRPAVPPATRRMPAAERPAPEQPTAWLIVRQGDEIGKTFPVNAGQALTLGRDRDQCNGFIDDATVSGRHAQVRYENGRFILYDLGSTNGTFLDEIPIQRQPLRDGVEVRLGRTILLFTTSRP